LINKESHFSLAKNLRIDLGYYLGVAGLYLSLFDGNIQMFGNRLGGTIKDRMVELKKERVEEIQRRKSIIGNG